MGVVEVRGSWIFCFCSLTQPVAFQLFVSFRAAMATRFEARGVAYFSETRSLYKYAIQFEGDKGTISMESLGSNEQWYV